MFRTSPPACVSSQHFWITFLSRSGKHYRWCEEGIRLLTLWQKKKIQTLRTLGGKKWDSISAEVTLWSVCLAFFVFSRFQEVIWGKRLKACLCLKHKISGSYVQPFTLTWNSPSETNSTWIIKSSNIKKKPQKPPQTDPNKTISYLLLNKVGLKAPKWIKSLQESDRIKSMSQGAGRKQGQLTVCHGATDLKGLHGSSF